ncbi:YggS family pyridoxal phosphate-dependent enzyme [Sulfuriflexus mobilis]|uniref:YggS family pyridoxal phosphate-dependent enzyme n=1 Tax=Sulfuriflexus mobilis TaxID=1811807 RepID=UPI000F83AB3F|nr:YggS family pyridoxal phosphate-dependent enzyme [Sulfuriflexus mobilis]
MTDITSRLLAVKQRIEQAAQRSDRNPDSVQLLAVSKTRPAEDIRQAHAAGQRAFGENYLQDALPKIAALADLDLEWHFIGAIQSNKSRDIAQHFDWVHTVERVKIARRLNEQRPPGAAPLNICLQVNISQEASKAGVSPDEVLPLARAIATLPNLRLRGLMAIPAASDDVAIQRAAFRALYACQQQLIAEGFELDTLSMGMSDDLEAAIAEGSTLVRIGTAIFGTRST